MVIFVAFQIEFVFSFDYLEMLRRVKARFNLFIVYERHIFQCLNQSISELLCSFVLPIVIAVLSPLSRNSLDSQKAVEYMFDLEVLFKLVFTKLRSYDYYPGSNRERERERFEV